MQQLLETLSELVQTATKLKEASATGLAKEEIEALQERQAELMHRIVEIDQKMAADNVQLTEDVQSKITAKLKEFQMLNHEFLEQLRDRISIIRFF
ncbi:MAG TPA: hypothetical protein VN457_00990 [Chlamydiales bacterium]|nr:hypothetical protein [Chlamydiales bacterium]